MSKQMKPLVGEVPGTNPKRQEELIEERCVFAMLVMIVSSGSVEEYVCWIDDITFPGNTVILDVESVADNNNMEVYPNPANDVINVKGLDIQCIEIYNTIGSKVISKNVVDSESINIADLTSGIYFVRIIDKQGNTTTTKIVKK